MSTTARLRSPAPPSTSTSPTFPAATGKTPNDTISTSQTASRANTRPSNTTPAVPAHTIYKLLLFTAAMFTLPLLFYYASVNVLFSGNATYAGAGAAGVANLVLFGYIFAAVMEDKSDETAAKGGKSE